MMTKELRAIGYTRVSTMEQAKEGVSLDAQSERIKAFSKAKGWQLLDIIQDKGYSGKDLNRPGIQELINMCKKGTTDIVIVFKVDRLTRQQKSLWSLLEDVFEPNIGFVSVTEPFDTTSATGKAFLGMIGVFSQMEGELIAERTREGLKHKKEKGEWISRPPVGFKINGKGHLEEDPVIIKKIQRAKRLRRDGKSYGEISKSLNMPKSTIYRLVNTHLKTLSSLYRTG